MMPNFQALAASLEGADAQSDEGRRQILAAAFESGCDLVLRVLLGPGGHEASRNPVLARIAHCKVELANYLTWCLVTDSSGQPKEALGQSDSLCKAFLSASSWALIT